MYLLPPMHFTFGGYLNQVSADFVSRDQSELGWLLMTEERFCQRRLGRKPQFLPTILSRHLGMRLQCHRRWSVSHVLTSGVAHGTREWSRGIQSLPNCLPSQAQNLVVAGQPVLNVMSRHR